MLITTLASTVTYRLRSLGNGWAYELAYKTRIDGHPDDWPTVWVQDDDATSFRQEWESLEKARPNWTQDRILQELFNQYSTEHLA